MGQEKNIVLESEHFPEDILAPHQPQTTNIEIHHQPRSKRLAADRQEKD